MNPTIAATAKNSLCQFCIDSNQNWAVPILPGAHRRPAMLELLGTVGAGAADRVSEQRRQEQDTESQS